MQRIELRGPLGDGPVMKPLQQNKYWATGGWNRVDLREKLNADAIDVVEVIEACKPWQVLKMPLVCKMCEKNKAGQPYLDQVHWCFQHCLQCKDFYICIDCVSTTAFEQLKKDHKGHKFSQITTRPLSAPIYDGSDLEQLELFRNSQTSQQFFTYFPWFFHCFAGMDQVREFNRAQTIAALEMSPTRGSPEWLVLMEMQSYPVDWYLRTFGRGDWQSLLQNMGPLLDARIQSAKVSIQLNKLLLKLQGYQAEKVTLFGPGDIPTLGEAEAWRPLAANLAPSMVNYTTYTIPLQFMTVLDPFINQAKLERLLVNPSHEEPSPKSPNHNQHTGGEGSSKNFLNTFRKLRLGKHKSTSADLAGQKGNDELSPDKPLLGPDTDLDPYREMTRLWPMFSVVFKDHPGYSDLVSPVMMSDLSAFFGKMKPSWNSFLSKDHLIRKRLWETDYKNLPEMTGENLTSLDSATAQIWPSTHPNHEALQQAQKLRIRGNFNEAIETLRPLHETDPLEIHIALQLQRVYVEQGYLQRAMACSPDVVKIDPRHVNLGSSQAHNEASEKSPQKDRHQDGPIARALLYLISSYLRCFVHGRWEVALTEAADVFDTYLIKWNPGEENISLLVYLEIYYHKILLATSRDLEKDIPMGPALARLEAIREHTCDLPSSSGFAPLAWDLLLTELEMLKRPVRDQYFDVEDAFSVAKYLHTATIALPIINKFLSSNLMVDVKSHAPEVLAASMMLEAEIAGETGQAFAVASMTGIAATIYAGLDNQPGLPSHVGLLDVEIFEIKTAGRSIPFSRAENLYAKLRERNDLSRMRILRRYNASLGSKDSPAYNWELFQRAGLRQLAKEAGDNLMYQRWNLRKYAGDSLSIASIHDAERVIANDETVAIHSSLLVVLASFNLSRAYMSVGNFFEAALNSLLHLSLTAQRKDIESHQRAILNVLHVFSEAVSNNTANPDELLKGLAVIWPGWLTTKSYDRWKAHQARCDEIDRFIDAALFIPNLAGRVGRENQRANDMIPKPYPTNLIDYMITHLRIGFALYEALPTYLAHIVLPKLSSAVGAVATYICNKELAIRAYSAGQCTAHSQDIPNLAMFRLKAGKLMTLLGEEDPEHWMHVVPAGRSLLSSAADKFLAHRALAGAQMRVCDANVSLLRSLVAEARARKLLLTERWKSLGGTVDDLDAFVYREIVTVVNLQEETMMPMTMTDILILRTAQRLVMASPYEASQNLAFLASSPIPRQNRELVIEFCYILSDLEPFQQKAPGTALITFIQRYKANVLYRQSFSNLVPARYLKAIEADPSALKLYQDEQRLIKEGPQAMGDHRLEELSGDMMNHPTLKPLLDHRHRTLRVVPEEFHSLASVARLTQKPASDLILVDWMKYHDYFMITGYNVTKQKICIMELIPDCKVTDVETWVEKHLIVEGKLLPTTLSSSAIFKDLSPLVRAIAESCSKEDLLVFSPSQELNSIPLHALPYSDVDDRPVIDYHPIVYTPSNIILKECVLRAIGGEAIPPTSASLFGRWGKSDAKGAEEEGNIKSSLDSISVQLSQIDVTSTIISGNLLTHSAFSLNMTQADILHFHTHVNETGIKQHLSLEPEIDTAVINDDFQRIPRSLNPFVHLRQKRRNDTYNLQDAFASQIRAKLVVMMGCRSGRQHISASDDALGLISAFFAAGASAIVASLWQFETSDASAFSSHFYRETFVQQKENALIDVASSFRRSVMEMRSCQKPICRRKKTLEQRLACHVLEEQTSPYHWAGFMLWGSLVLRGVGVEGGVSDDVKEEILEDRDDTGNGKAGQNMDVNPRQPEEVRDTENPGECKTQ